MKDTLKDSYYFLRLYRGDSCASVSYEKEELARESFAEIKDHVGSPLAGLSFSVDIDGERVGVVTYQLDKFDRADLVELEITSATEIVLDSVGPGVSSRRYNGAEVG